MRGLSAEIRNLRFSVEAPAGRQPIADIPELALPAGRLTALCGPSGSGKSTFLYLLAGLLVPQQGEVLWSGTDITRLPETARDRWRLAHAGFVFQSFNLVDELPPVDNVLLPAWFANIGVGERRRRAEALLDRFGVPTARARVSLLSRGEQQRVAIARALLLEPRIVFADEPTASLDAKSGEFVAETLAALAAEEGRTVVVATHDPVLIARAGGTVSIDHGRIQPPSPALAA